MNKLAQADSHFAAPMAAWDAASFDGLIKRYAPSGSRGRVRVLDLGCGAGGLVRGLQSLGYDCKGCDVEAEVGPTCDRIQWGPYRLPYPDGSFDVVISNQVMEHVQNKAETLAEVARVLRPGGVTINIFPSKWSFLEPHMFVPIASWLWPRVPMWWLNLWAWLGVRNSFQRGLQWREVAQKNAAFCRANLDYRDARELREVFVGAVGPVTYATDAYLDVCPGRGTRLLRKLPGRRLVAALLAVLKVRVVVAAKA